MRIENNVVHGPLIENVPNISLGQHVFDSLLANGDHMLQADVETGEHLTSKDVLERSKILANFLKNYGINVEDRISIASENHPNYIIVVCSTLFSAATFAPLNPAYTEREFRHMLDLFQPRLIFVSRRTEKVIAKIASSINWTMKLVQLEDEPLDSSIITLKEILNEGASTASSNNFEPVRIDDNGKRTAAILCSSGTTGFPKGVMLSHRNLIIYIRSCRCPSLMDIRPGDRVLIFLPMFHGYAFGLLNIAIHSDSVICLMRNYKLETFLRTIERYRVTHLPLVPPILVALSKHPLVSKYDFSSVREITSGAAPLPKSIAEDVKRRTGVRYVRNGYGMTELTIVSNISDRETEDQTIGPVIPSFKSKVVDTESGRTLGPKEIGEICFMGDQVMLGYFKNPKITAETIDRDGWLHTGDLGYYDEQGNFYITGRIKELIKYKGFQVSPSEIEMLLLDHPAVKDVAIVGKPDETSGEVPMAFVVKQPNRNVTEKEIKDFVKENLSPQKQLRGGVKFVENIPKTPSGKILRRELLSSLSKL